MPKRVKRKRPVRTEDGMEVRLLTNPACMGVEGGGNGPVYLAHVLLTECAVAQAPTLRRPRPYPTMGILGSGDARACSSVVVK